MYFAALLSLIFFASASRTLAQDASQDDMLQSFYSQGNGHTNNWAVLVCASRYWFNYRVSSASLNQCKFMLNLNSQQHMANALGM